MFGPKRIAVGITPGSGGSPSGSFGPGPTSARSQRKAARALKEGDFGDLGLNELSGRYTSGLMFYDTVPGCDINLEMMEALAVERLRFLRIFEKNASLKDAPKYSKEWRQSIVSDAKTQGLEAYVNLFSTIRAASSSNELSVLQNRSRDHFSHFVLRLAYSRTDELRRWFVQHEVDAFKLKLMTASPNEIADFMAIHDLSFAVVADAEKAALRDDLNAALKSTYSQNSNVDSLAFYKVHFTEALDLVRKRSVLVRNGMCFVPDTEMSTLLAFMFKSLLTQNLAYTAKILPNLDEDERLIKMLSDLDRRYTGSDDFSGEASDVVTPEMIKPLANDKGCFPMCMRSMQASLEDAHHLKYKARLQYGLFLKGIGLSMDDAIRFFRGEFTKSHVDPEKFDKEYTYGIRYNYGKEGKKVNWAPWNCMRIIMESVGPGENHGCPYKHHDPDVLRAALVKSGLGQGEDLNQIMQAAKEGHFQKACSLQFKASHKGQELSTGIVNHPNQFYSESVHGGVPSSSGQATGSSSANKLKTEKAHLYLDGKTAAAETAMEA